LFYRLNLLLGSVSGCVRSNWGSRLLCSCRVSTSAIAFFFVASDRYSEYTDDKQETEEFLHFVCGLSSVSLQIYEN
jgi:hypothetical protein